MLYSQNGGVTWKIADLGIKVYDWLTGIDFYEDKLAFIVGGHGAVLRSSSIDTQWEVLMDANIMFR